jgi:ribosome recycling factor
MFNIDDCNQEMDLSIEAFKNDLKNIRTGRVSPDILKTVIIDSYGSKMPLTQLSNINNIDNMTLSISIWDSSLVKSIEKNLLESNLGATPQTDGSNILLKFPELTSERRKELVKLILETSEKFKISIRNVRRKFIDLVKDLEKNKSISIDDSKKFQDDIQKSTDLSISKIDDNSKLKENEILKV